MVSFSLKNECYDRLISFTRTVSGGDSDKLLELKLFESHIFIPVEFGVAISSVLYTLLQSDSTIRVVDIGSLLPHRFHNELNSERILRLLSDNSYEVHDLSSEDIHDFFDFGCCLGCPFFIFPLLEEYTSTNFSATEENKSKDALEKIREFGAGL